MEASPIGFSPGTPVSVPFPFLSRDLDISSVSMLARHVMPQNTMQQQQHSTTNIGRRITKVVKVAACGMRYTMREVTNYETYDSIQSC